MTRINVVPVESLNNQHLIAEYKEITRPFNKVISRIAKHGVDKALCNVNIPEKYVLGKGHESFFFNKLEWLWERRYDIYKECCIRGFNIDSDAFYNISDYFLDSIKNTPYWNNYSPTHEDIYVNMTRLVKNHSKNNVDIREELER